MDQLNLLSTSEKEQLMRYLGYVYRKGMIQNRAMTHVEQESEAELIELLRALLKQMKRNYAIIILNDFFEIKERGWWHSMYSPSTYYRSKKAAVALLLEQLYGAQQEFDKK